MSERDRLLEALAGAELWHGPTRDPFVTVAVRDHRENFQIRSDQARHWLTYAHLATTGRAPSRAALDEALATAAARAIYEGPTLNAAQRVAGLNGTVYIDLCDDTWRAVEIDGHGWRVVANPPVKFVRSPSMAPLPDPVADEDGLRHLAQLINTASGDDDAEFRVVVSWLVGAFRASGPYPVLMLTGEQGAAKTTCARILQDLVDPSHIRGRSLPRDERELFIATRHSYALFFDNVSSLPKELSDALARLSTGGGFATRRLHSNDEEEIFTATRPVCLNGIPEFITRPDLLDRTLTVTLEAIPESRRRTEGEVLAEFTRARPAILGHIFDAVSAALRRHKSLTLPSKTRMADFELWVTAAEPALGWDDGAFSALYRDLRKGSFAATVEDDPVAAAIVRMMEARPAYPWVGTATDLLSAVNLAAADADRQNPAWPRTARRMSEAVTRAATSLRHAALDVRKFKENSARRRRLIEIRPLAGGSAGDQSET